MDSLTRMYAQTKHKQIDAYTLACFVFFAVPFDGGESRPGMLHFLSGYICSCYDLLKVHKLDLLVQLLVTVLQPLGKLRLNVSLFLWTPKETSSATLGQNLGV